MPVPLYLRAKGIVPYIGWNEPWAGGTIDLPTGYVRRLNDDPNSEQRTGEAQHPTAPTDMHQNVLLVGKVNSIIV